MKKLVFILLLFFPLVVFSCTKKHSQLELDYISEINLMRSNPSAYTEKVKAYIANPVIDSVSRRIAMEEVIPILLKTSTMPPLKINENGRWLLESHAGIDSIKREVQHADIWSTNWLNAAENIVGGSTNKASSSIIILLIDAVTPSRGHRKILLNSSYQEISVKRVVFGDENNTFGRRIFWIQEFILQR